jgi:hypothetical protein
VAKFIEVYPQLTAELEQDQTRAAVADLPAAVAVPGEPRGADDGDIEASIEEIPRLVAAGLSLEEAASVLIGRLKRRLTFATAALYVPRIADDRLEAIHVSGVDAELFRQSVIHLSEGLSGWVAAHGQFIVNANPALDLLGPMASRNVALDSALVVPFTGAGGSRGALALYAEAADSFSLDHARLAAAAAAALTKACRVSSRPVAVGTRVQAA